MGQYNVVAPCTVDGKSYVNPTAQPIKVADDKAKPLVQAGCLEPYGVKPAGIEGLTGTIVDGEVNLVEPEEDPKPRKSRRSED